MYKRPDERAIAALRLTASPDADTRAVAQQAFAAELGQLLEYTAFSFVLK